MKVSTRQAFRAGLLRKCPRCCEGKLFSKFLTVAPRCGRCGLDFSKVDSGDGPAVFVVLVLGFIIVGLALWVEVALAPPYWIHAVLWLPLAVVGVAFMLPWFKATLIAFQYKNDAEEGRLDEF
ncbi:MAG: DUF983 domain-containing protein [Alphaproteobacteria bacterium]|nr:MAG: DUF983 domain-containing protein [Alphaproteobacteria bacterium]